MEKETYTHLTEVAKDAIEELVQLDFWDDIQIIPKSPHMKVCIEKQFSFSRYIILKNVEGVPPNPEGGFCVNCDFKWLDEENKYCLYGKLQEEDSLYPFRLTFSDAEMEIESYNGIEEVFASCFFKNPWDVLYHMVCDINEKASFSEKYCNEKELELLPLLKEIQYLRDWYVPIDKTKVQFPLLKSFVRKYGYQKLFVILEKMEKTTLGNWKYNYWVQKLLAKLCEKQYEPLWREIFHQIEFAQREYKKKVDLYNETSIIVEKRSQIQKKMEQEGFTGTYPDFVKRGEMPKIHLEESYGLPYFVGKEKNVVYRIHCFETIDDSQYFSIKFLCGTTCLRQKEEEEDIYSCLFDANGKRLFHTVQFYMALGEVDEVQEELSGLFGIRNLDDCVTVAIKKVELRPLTKEERKEYYGTSISGLGLFLGIFFVVGGLFTIFMTLGFMGITLLTAIIVGEIGAIPELFCGIPWGLFVAMLWIGYGLAMAIIMVLVMRK